MEKKIKLCSSELPLILLSSNYVRATKSKPCFLHFDSQNSTFALLSLNDGINHFLKSPEAVMPQTKSILTEENK